MTAIFARELVKHFSGDVRAVDGIDLSIKAGQLFAFLGPNGSGKTTTIRMLTTLLRPTSGRAEVAGLDVIHQASEVRKRIGVALQEAGLDDLQTGRELLELQGHLYRLPGDRSRDRAVELLKIIDLDGAADRPIKTYSGGMRRRLDLAAALMHEPKIVFLDEPTTGLDIVSRETMWRYVGALNREEGVTFFLTTQYLEEADRLADEVAIIANGRIVAQGSPDELKASIGTDVVTVHIQDGNGLDAAQNIVRGVGSVEDIRIVGGSLVVYVRDGSSAIARIVVLLEEAALPVAQISLTRPTLDDVFLRKTGHHIEIVEPAGAAAKQTGA